VVRAARSGDDARPLARVQPKVAAQRLEALDAAVPRVHVNHQLDGGKANTKVIPALSGGQHRSTLIAFRWPEAEFGGDAHHDFGMAAGDGNVRRLHRITGRC